MSERKMCSTCPFNPESKTFNCREEWAKFKEIEIKQYEFETQINPGPHGCHNIEDDCPCKPENVCIGHRDYLAGIRHEKVSLLISETV